MSKINCKIVITIVDLILLAINIIIYTTLLIFYIFKINYEKLI